MPNCDPKTGTPYGVVALNSLEDWVFEEFLNHGVCLSADAAFDESGVDPDDFDAVEEFWNFYEGEEEEYEYKRDGLWLGLSYLGGAPLVWVFKSPHVASCRPCSPCVPGAGDLDSKVEPGEGVICYDLPPDWYYNDPAEVCEV